MTVGADHHPTGKGVLLQHHLVDDPRARLPEPGAVAGAHRGQEVVNLTVAVHGGCQIALAVISSFDEVVAVGGRRNLNLVEASGHELQPSHLGSGILHGYPVGPQIYVGHASLEVSVLGIVKVVDEHLFGQCEGPSESVSTNVDPLVKGVVDAMNQLDGGGCSDGHGQPPTRCRWMPTGGSGPWNPRDEGLQCGR